MRDFQIGAVFCQIFQTLIFDEQLSQWDVFETMYICKIFAFIYGMYL